MGIFWRNTLYLLFYHAGFGDVGRGDIVNIKDLETRKSNIYVMAICATFDPSLGVASLECRCSSNYCFVDLHCHNMQLGHPYVLVSNAFFCCASHSLFQKTVPLP